MSLLEIKLKFSATRNMRVYDPSSDFCREDVIAHKSLSYRSMNSAVALKNLILSSREILDLHTIFRSF